MRCTSIIAGLKERGRKRILALAVVLLAAWGTQPTGAALAASAADLRKRHALLEPRLRHNDFGRAIVLESREAEGAIQGEVFAVFDQPFEKVRSGLSGAARWCDVLMLPINSRYCQAIAAGSDERIALGIGGKESEQGAEPHRMTLAYRASSAASDYMSVHLTAEAGPFGTSDYRILIEAVPLDGRRTFLHLTYGYSYGLAARMAMQAYLGTAGRTKVGFTRVGRSADGSPQYVGGMRGIVERTTMRYYLALDAFLSALDAPPGEQLDRRLNTWFSATETYPRQLREISRAQYLRTKHREHARPQAALGGPSS